MSDFKPMKEDESRVLVKKHENLRVAGTRTLQRDLALQVPGAFVAPLPRIPSWPFLCGSSPCPEPAP